MEFIELVSKRAARKLVDAVQDCILDGITEEQMSQILSNRFPGMSIMTIPAPEVKVKL